MFCIFSTFKTTWPWVMAQSQPPDPPDPQTPTPPHTPTAGWGGLTLCHMWRHGGMFAYDNRGKRVHLCCQSCAGAAERSPLDPQPPLPPAAATRSSCILCRRTRGTCVWCMSSPSLLLAQGFDFIPSEFKTSFWTINSFNIIKNIPKGKLKKKALHTTSLEEYDVIRSFSRKEW